MDMVSLVVVERTIGLLESQVVMISCLFVIKRRFPFAWRIQLSSLTPVHAKY